MIMIEVVVVKVIPEVRLVAGETQAIVEESQVVVELLPEWRDFRHFVVEQFSVGTHCWVRPESGNVTFGQLLPVADLPGQTLYFHHHHHF